MKQIFKLSLIFSALLAVVAACKSGKSVVASEKEVIVPCREAVTNGDKKFFRANGMGESQSETVSKEKALMVAQNLLATTISNTVKTVTDRYTNSREVGTREDLESKFESLNRQVVDQTLTGVRVICEKLYKTDDGKYKTYLAVELSADELATKYKETLSKNEKIQVDYDYEKFRKDVFDELERRKNN